MRAFTGAQLAAAAVRATARADRIRADLPRIVTELRAHGAGRIWLVGSLAWGGEHEASDLDLAVEGLAGAAWSRAVAAIRRDCPIEDIDRLMIEEAPPALAARARRPHSGRSLGATAMTLPAHARLVAALRGDRATFERLVARTALALSPTAWPVDRDDAGASHVALLLHHACSVFESMAERIADTFEGEGRPPRSERSHEGHQNLLDAMASDIPGIRPAVVGGDTLAALHDLLGFRHFVRHAYAVAWRLDRLRSNAETLVAVAPALARDLDAFEALLLAA